MTTASGIFYTDRFVSLCNCATGTLKLRQDRFHMCGSVYRCHDGIAFKACWRQSYCCTQCSVYSTEIWVASWCYFLIHIARKWFSMMEEHWGATCCEITRQIICLTQDTTLLVMPVGIPSSHLHRLTLNLLTTTIVAPPSNASKWQMGFNSAFKGLIIPDDVLIQFDLLMMSIWCSKHVKRLNK
jgi:hypothetical protein